MKYFRALSVNLLAFTIGVVFFIITTPISIRVMGSEFFGIWSIFYSILVLSGIGTFGMDAVVTKFAAEKSIDEDDVEERLRVSKTITAAFMIIGLLAMMAAIIMAAFGQVIVGKIAVSGIYQQQFRQAIVLLGVAIVPLYLVRVPEGYLLSQVENGIVRTGDIASTMSLWTGAIIISTFQRNIAWIAIWAIVSNTIYFLLFLKIMVDRASVRVVVSVDQFKKMFKFGTYVFVESIGIALFQQTDRILVGIASGPIIAGIYSVGTAAATRLSVIAGEFTMLMIPFASKAQARDDTQRLFLYLRVLTRYISLILGLLGGLLAIWADLILRIWISNEYATQYANAFRILFIAYALFCMARPGHQTLTGIGKVTTTSVTYLAASLVALTLIYVLSLRSGLVGAAYANAAFALILYLNYAAYHSLSDAPQIGRLLRVLLGDLGWGLAALGIAASFLALNPGAAPLAKIIVSAVLVLLVGAAIALDRDMRTILRQFLDFAFTHYLGVSRNA